MKNNTTTAAAAATKQSQSAAEEKLRSNSAQGTHGTNRAHTDSLTHSIKTLPQSHNTIFYQQHTIAGSTQRTPAVEG